MSRVRSKRHIDTSRRMLSPLVFPLDQKALATDHRFQVIAVSGGGGGERRSYFSGGNEFGATQ